MMAPDYAHWHGMFEVADRFYQHLIPEARELADKAERRARVAADAEISESLLNLAKAYRTQADVMKAKRKQESKQR